MTDFTHKTDIDGFIVNNDLNASLYQILLYYQDSHFGPFKLTRTPLETLNYTYALCEHVKTLEHPEELIESIWNSVEQSFFHSDISIFFSCVYVILYFSSEDYPNVKYFLNCLLRKIDPNVFSTFKTLCKEEPTIASIKVRSVVIMELLKKIHCGTTRNDLTKICKLIAFLTGNSYKNIYNEMQKGVRFSPYHTNEIDEINKILSDLNTSILIDKNKDY